MPVELLPFQKIVDIPDVAQRHRCAIRGLAISSIVLSSIGLCLFVPASISTAATSYYSITGFMVFLTILGIISMGALFFIVCVSSVVSLHNTDKWVSTDMCCNLMRHRPACCTRSCSSNKRCCARLSCAYTAAAVLASVLCILAIGMAFSGCRRPTYSSYGVSHYDYGYSRHYYKQGIATTAGTIPNSYDYDYSTILETGRDTTIVATATTTAAKLSVSRHKYAASGYYSSGYSSGYCALVLVFDIPVIVLLVSLVVTTAASAWMVRRVEHELPALALLPAGKMVVQAVAYQDATVSEEVCAQVVVGNAHDTGNEKPSIE